MMKREETYSAGQAFALKSFFLGVGMLILMSPLSSQPLRNEEGKDDDGSYYIQYIGQFPSGEKKRTTGFFERIGIAVLGGDPLQLNKPLSILVDDPESFWILDQGNGMVFRNSGGTLSLPKALRRNKLSLSSLVGIAAAGDDDVLFTDSRENKVFRLSAGGRELVTFNGNVALDQPTGIAYSPVAKEIWVSETGSHRIAVFNRHGELVRHIGSRGTGEGEFNFPTFIWIDASGMAYIVDAMNFRIQIFDRYGKYVSSFGEHGNATGYFARPKGVAVDSRGNIYVADALFNAVQIFDRKGNFLYYFGSQGRGREQFWMPSGIFIDKDDFIYIADSYNARIQIFQLKKGDRNAKN